jgi:hypothetical protein
MRFNLAKKSPRKARAFSHKREDMSGRLAAGAFTFFLVAAAGTLTAATFTFLVLVVTLTAGTFTAAAFTLLVIGLAARTLTTASFALLVIGLATRTFTAAALVLTNHVADLKCRHLERALDRVGGIYRSCNGERACEGGAHSQGDWLNHLLL